MSLYFFNWFGFALNTVFVFTLFRHFALQPPYYANKNLC
jgi:hypothetical protein